MSTNDRPSRSAMLVAACRAIASDFDEHVRLIRDPFARVVADEQAMSEARDDHHLVGNIELRTRYIDDEVAAFAERHPDAQVVLLGAGFDARALRLSVDSHFFEVDFPTTLDLKSRLLHGSSVSARRTMVPVDLTTSALGAALRDHGHIVGRPTIIVWEGVTFYLTPSQIEAVLDQLGEITRPGDRLVCDYADARSSKPARMDATQAIGRRLREGNEPLRRIIDDMVVALDSRGFTVVDDQNIDLLRARWQPDRDAVAHFPARILTAERR